ncbi:conserved hypothetical protein [Gloeothece citriformis PCC 7424]|uniref:Uncharacterized protein n=1 Tax=Gloeothece citriformis (strain PCC 7424) TaxID=65393 RepID=B7KGB0_GLOC7|nr:hypothetical protein [Gloeothece citriformis]ACK70581.1 conserved hypothetical protein [Gloeothece citriformis PCC 7424]
MLNSNTHNTPFIRNYIIAAVSVSLLSFGIADMFHNPFRVAQQDKLDGYGRYIGVGLVSYGKSLSR